MSLSDLKRFIRIEDDIRTRVKNKLLSNQKMSANMVTSRSNKDFFKKKKFKKKNVQKKEFKKTGRCFNCGKQGHFAKASKVPKKEEKDEAHHANQDDNIVAMLFCWPKITITRF